MLVEGIETLSYTISPSGEIHNLEGLLMKQFETHDGYMRTRLCRGVKSKMYRIHRLVAENYIPNPHNYPVVNHLNGVREDNRVENLEWCTIQRNTAYSYELFPRLGTKAKKVIQLTMEGEFIKEWDTPKTAFLELGIQAQNISKVARGERVHAGGFKWTYLEGSETIEQAEG